MNPLPPPLLTFIHISDTHLHHVPAYTGPFVDFSAYAGVETLIEALNALPFPIDFVLHTGDIMTDPESAVEYQVAARMLSQIRYPIYYLVGNHDRSEDVQSVMMGYPPEQIRPNLDYEFSVNGVQIICLDSNRPEGHSGRLEANQLAWLDNLCRADDPRPLVVALHHHTLPLAAPWLDGIVLENGAELHRILLQTRHRLRGVFYGHIHENTVTTRDGISYYSTLSAWFQTRTWYNQLYAANDPLLREPGFSVVTLTEQDTFVRFYRYPLKTR